jgi:hypothetical protein
MTGNRSLGQPVRSAHDWTTAAVRIANRMRRQDMGENMEPPAGGRKP